jgi:hypothetical protein
VTLNWVFELELMVSAAHQEANMIKDFKEKASDENKSDFALLEDNLNAKRASITNDIKKRKELPAGLVQVHGNAIYLELFSRVCTLAKIKDRSKKIPRSTYLSSLIEPIFLELQILTFSSFVL